MEWISIERYKPMIFNPVGDNMTCIIKTLLNALRDLMAGRNPIPMVSGHEYQETQPDVLVCSRCGHVSRGWRKE